MAITHIEQASLNHAFARGLSARRVEARQWAVIAVFYSAVHSVRHAAEATRLQPSAALRRDSHAWNEAWMRQHARDLYADYRGLRRCSEEARYLLRETDRAQRDWAIARAGNLLGLASTGELPLATRRAP
ncbi:MAG: hypothetical protein IT303_17195 [Dehalococcoidia bacterium]|nr:hypothetical protein [Dehalococcoidia bacterium]